MAKLVLLSTLCLLLAVPVLAAPPVQGYIYNRDQIPVPAPMAYAYSREIAGVPYGIGSFNKPEDMAVGKDGSLYVLDTGNNRLVIFDDNMQLVANLSEFRYGDEMLTLKNPRGLFLYEYDLRHDNDVKIYIADTGNARILRCDKQGNVDKVYENPNIVLSDRPYAPLKLVVDRAERMFVVSEHINRGLVKLNANGEWENFFGAPQTTITPLERILRSLFTPEQLSKRQQNVPTEYSNVAYDHMGFIYATIASQGDQKAFLDTFNTRSTDTAARAMATTVRKLAADGTDILLRGGMFPPVGDLALISTKTAAEKVDQGGKQATTGIAQMVDVAVNENGVYSLLDQNRGKVFTYDTEGNLLYILGKQANQKGTFRRPSAIAYKGDLILVLDMLDNSVTVFRPTDYGNAINQAITAYRAGEYQKAEEFWTKVLKMNSNMTIAYSGVGKAKMRAGDFKGAMADFKIAQDPYYYSRALDQHMQKTIGNQFTYIFLAIVGGYLLYQVYRLIRAIRRFLREGVKKVV